MRKRISTISQRIGIGVLFTMIAAGEAANIGQQFDHHWEAGFLVATQDLLIDPRKPDDKCTWQERLSYRADMMAAGTASFVAPFLRWGMSGEAVHQSLPMLGAFMTNGYAMQSGASRAFDLYCNLPRSAPGEKSQDRLLPTKPLPALRRENDYTI